MLALVLTSWLIQRAPSPRCVPGGARERAPRASSEPAPCCGKTLLTVCPHHCASDPTWPPRTHHTKSSWLLSRETNTLPVPKSTLYASSLLSERTVAVQYWADCTLAKG